MKKIIFILFAAMFFVSLSVAQKINYKKCKDIPIDPSVLTGTLPNGMKYFIQHNNFPKDRVEFYLVLNVGAILEEDDQNGIAHFTEHMAFNGTKNFPGKNIINFMEQNGVSFGHNVNASTSQDMTIFKLSNVPIIRETLIDSTLFILHDWSAFISFEPAEIEAERGVIHEEWRSRRNAEFRLRNKTMDVVYNNSKYSQRDVIGDINVIDNFKYQSILSFYNDWYRPDLQCLIIIGDIDPKQIEAKIKKVFENIPKRLNVKNNFEINIPNNEEPLISVATDSEALKTSIKIYYKQNDKTEKSFEKYKNKWINDIFIVMLKNRLNELIQDENSTFIDLEMNFLPITKTKNAYIFDAVSMNKFAAKSLESLLSENERIKLFGFTKNEFRRARSSVYGRIKKKYKEKDNQQSKDLVNQYINYFVYEKEVPGIEYENKYASENIYKIDLKDLNNFAKNQLSDQNIAITITGPEKENVTLPSVEDIKKIIESIKTKKFEERVEINSKDQLLSFYPNQDFNVKEKVDNNVTEWIFQNGVKVIIKNTDFKEDEIFMTSFAFGGYSSVAEQELASAKMISEIVDMNGVGAFSKIILDKKIQRKGVSFSLYLEKNYHGFLGRCPIPGLETLLQLNYLYMTKPRFIESTFNAFMIRKQAKYENIGINPDNKFNDSVYCILNNYNSRRKPLNLDYLNEVKFDQVKKVYNDLYTNANGLTFIFVGNLKPENVKQLFSIYFGGMPSTKILTNWNDEHIISPRGITKKKLVMKMEIPKSKVFVGFSGKFDLNNKSVLEIDVLEYILKMRYFETIREKESGSYGVSVNSKVGMFPYQNYYFNFNFDCDPRKADELVKIIYREIMQIQEQGPTLNEIQKTLEYLRKTRNENINKNQFWQKALFQKYYFGFDIDAVDNYDDQLKNISIESIKSAANRFFDMNNYIELISVPE